MSGWEHRMVVSDVSGTLRPDVSKVWEQRDPEGNTDWERLRQLGHQGWELVSSFPVATGGGGTIQIVWVLKRPASA